jgi:hypothetical protein
LKYQIRDEEWILEDSSSLYHALFYRLHKLWQFHTYEDSVSFLEGSILRIWSGIVFLNEYDASIAYQSITEIFLEEGTFHMKFFHFWLN